jgi:glycosyltransferase involved in cell wall biosynthesis
VIGIVAPALETSGGVQALAARLVDHIEAEPVWDYVLVSLATSATDDCSTRLARPSTWFAEPGTRALAWQGRQVTHVGSAFAEIEFLRYRSRAALRTLLARCDLIQVVCGTPAWGAAVLDCGKPVGIWAATRSAWERRALHGEARGPRAAWRRLMAPRTDRLDATAVRRAAAVMVMNSRMRDYAMSMRPGTAGSVVYAPPGVDTSWFSPAECRETESGGPARPYVLSVGRFGDPRKRPSLLLRAYARLTRAPGTGPALVLAGATEPPAAFWREVSDLGLRQDVSFRLAPPAGDLRDLYRGALCFGLSSDEEGFGLVLAEAMACGVPAVVTRCGVPAVVTRCGGPDDIIEDGVDGFLVPVGDERAFAARLECLCADPETNRQMGRRARHAIETRFSIGAMRAAFSDTWTAMLAARNHVRH